MDNFTLMGIIITLITMGLIIFSIWYSHTMTQVRLQKLAKATMALQANQDEQALCKAIKEIRPDACPLLDYTIHVKGDVSEIRDWSGKGAKPSSQELKAVLHELKDKLQKA